MKTQSLFTGSLLAGICATVSTATFANNSINTSTFYKSGFYAGVQGGRSDTFYHPSNALTQAANNGVGTISVVSYNSNHTPLNIITTTSSNLLTGQKTDSIGLGGRIYAGYQFNPYFALEMGYTQYAKTSFHALGTLTSDQTLSLYRNGTFQPANLVKTTTSTTKYNGEITEHAVDLVAKGTLPLQYGFGLYAKAGVAYIQTNSDTNANVAGPQTCTNYNGFDQCGNNNIATNINTNNYRTISTKTYQAFRPVAGLGLNYTIPGTDISIDGSYTRVFSYGGIPNADLLALGIEYKFA